MKDFPPKILIIIIQEITKGPGEWAQRKKLVRKNWVTFLIPNSILIISLIQTYNYKYNITVVYNKYKKCTKVVRLKKKKRY